jgi:hypothetical protein
MLGNKAYDKMKFVALILLPAMTTLYFTLGAIWKLPHVEEVIGSMTAFDTFLGLVLGLSTKSYNGSEAKYAGQIVIHTPDEGPKMYSLELNGPPEDLDMKKEITFKVAPAVVLEQSI